MSEALPQTEYLVLSRGQWDNDASKEEIEAAIQKFYAWLGRNVEQGRMRTGYRLKRERALVSGKGVTLDGPFSEGKEVIGGYWFIVARDLAEAAALAGENPCAQYGLCYEIRPLEPEQASAYKVASETPDEQLASVK